MCVYTPCSNVNKNSNDTSLNDTEQECYDEVALKERRCNKSYEDDYKSYHSGRLGKIAVST